MCAGLARADVKVRALRTLGRATAACRGGGEAQEAACGGSKVAIPAILTRLPDPGGAPCAYSEDCKVSTFGRALGATPSDFATSKLPPMPGPGGVLHGLGGYGVILR